MRINCEKRAQKMQALPAMHTTFDSRGKERNTANEYEEKRPCLYTLDQDSCFLI
jgi:hypothetical protein